MNVTDRFREEWRCPYCDGLNSWENETCRICGDGRRPEPEKAPTWEPEASNGFASTTLHADPVPSSDAPPAPEVSMKWHRFLVAFALWASAALFVINGLRLLTGGHYGDGDMAAMVYARFGSLKTVDSLFGLLDIALAAYAIYVRFQVAGFREGAPSKLTALYALNLISNLGYLAAFAATVQAPLAQIMDSTTVSAIVANAVMLFANRAYYKKRSHLFGDHPAAEPAPPSGSAAPGLCPRCGAKVEAGDAFCVQCGAKLR